MKNYVNVKEIRNFRFYNYEKFEKWVHEKTSSSQFREIYYRPYYEDLINQYCNNASNNYELGSFETLSHNPETIDYEVEVILDEEEEVLNINIIF